MSDIEISDDVFIIPKDAADTYVRNRERPPDPEPEPGPGSEPGREPTPGPEPEPGTEPIPVEQARALRWAGDVPAQKWMNFYMKVLSGFAADSELKLTLNVEVAPEGGVSEQKVEETKLPLRELGLPDDIETV